jgi:signal transduction histidine kinase
LRLRERALALGRRAAFEHVIAENSTRLINIPLQEANRPLEHVLGEFCQAMGAERAYVVLDEKPLRVHACSVGAAAYPPGWPNQALALSARFGLGGPDIIAVRDVAALPPGTAKNTLAAAGVRSWACVPLIRAGGVRGIMGFDAFRPALHSDLPLPVVRLAGDAVANAIEREFLERDRARLAARLERARRLQMIGSLASGIAHNFNNVIGAILGYSEMVQSQLAPGSKTAQHISEIRRAAERGRDLIENILSFGRPRGGHLRSVQVRGLFDEAAALLRATLPSGIELTIENTPVDLAVVGEPAQLQQVMFNLCTNAAQAIESSGHIRVSAQQKDAAEVLQLSHGELQPGRYVCLAVADNGHGFDEAVGRRLFEPFFTTRATGTGLGLATVHEIVRDHEGAMNVQSHPGHGSRFEAWLPAAAVDDIAMVHSAMLSLGRGQTVLVINCEREQLLRDEEMLAALGYEPVGFERADDAIAACRSTPDRFDLIIVSGASQPRAGLELARKLHEIAPQHPLLLATASEIDGNLSALAQAGISEVLRRPVASTELASALARCLRPSGVLQP